MTPQVCPDITADLPQLEAIPAFAEAEFVAVCALWSDQGMAHLVEIYEKGGNGVTPSALVLIDFGTEIHFKSRVLKNALVAPAVNYVVARLQDQVNGGKTPRLDYVVVSHQDTDHWSMLNYLMDAIEAQTWKDNFKVGKICRGGLDWGKSAKKCLTRLAGYVADASTDYVPWTTNITNYADPDEDPGQAFNIGNVVFRILTVNAPISSKKADLKKNGTSAVIVVEFAGRNYVLPGDATYETLKDANKYLKKWADEGKTPLQPCFCLSVPHHGSLRTIVPNYKATELDFAIVREFTAYLKPHSTIASAGIRNGFRHPYLEVLLEFSKFVGNDVNLTHQIVFFSNEKQDWGSFVLTGLLFTTQLTLQLPIKAADWRFAMNEAGHTYITSLVFDGITKEVAIERAKAAAELEKDDDELASSRQAGTDFRPQGINFRTPPDQKRPRFTPPPARAVAQPMWGTP